MKRFYKEVSVEARDGHYGVSLDGRPIKTPQRAELVVANRALAEAIADEWREQGDEIVPDEMPTMRYAATTIDRVAPGRDEINQIVTAFGGHDLVCYRAEEADLAALQNDLWQPLLDWLTQTHQAALVVTSGIVSVEQPGDAMSRLEAEVAAFSDGEIAALHVMTSLTGSLVVALALAAGEIDVEGAWRAATVDETHQADNWGLDSEAEARLANRHHELADADRYLGLCRSQ